MTQDELDMFSMTDVTEEDGPGYILEVDLAYPEELHLPHNSFPLAPESVEIDQHQLSPYSLSCLREVYRKTKHKATKLTSTFRQR